MCEAAPASAWRAFLTSALQWESSTTRPPAPRNGCARCEGHSATCTWSGEKLPYQFTRRITLHPEGWVAFAYSATNTGAHRIPFVWSSHPVFPLTARTRLVLPDGARVKLWSQSGVKFGNCNHEVTTGLCEGGRDRPDAPHAARTNNSSSGNLSVCYDSTSLRARIYRRTVKLG